MLKVSSYFIETLLPVSDGSKANARPGDDGRRRRDGDVCVPGGDCAADEPDHQHVLLKQRGLPPRTHLQLFRCSRQDPLRESYRSIQARFRQGPPHQNYSKQGICFGAAFFI